MQGARVPTDEGYCSLYSVMQSFGGPRTEPYDQITRDACPCGQETWLGCRDWVSISRLLISPLGGVGILGRLIPREWGGFCLAGEDKIPNVRPHVPSWGASVFLYLFLYFSPYQSLVNQELWRKTRSRSRAS